MNCPKVKDKYGFFHKWANFTGKKHNIDQSIKGNNNLSTNDCLSLLGNKVNKSILSFSTSATAFSIT
jgi:hypothetical protein